MTEQVDKEKDRIEKIGNNIFSGMALIAVAGVGFFGFMAGRYNEGASRLYSPTKIVVEKNKAYALN